jgi:RNA polymerase sigma-70 factor, ECF subfamily
VGSRAVTNAITDEDLREQLPRLRRFALWLTRDSSAADDLVQACLERALTRWRSRDPSASLKSWLFTILYRQFVDSKRRADRFNRLAELFEPRETEPTEPSAEEAFVASSSLEAFTELTPDHQAILLLVAVEGLSYQETAAALNVPIGTVMSRLSRARQAYRSVIEGEPATPVLRRVK